MTARIREVRRARGLTLEEVAKRCVPPTTPQTIGRLETGARTVSVGWLARIAPVLGVQAQDLVERDETDGLTVIAVLGHSGAAAPPKPLVAIAPRAAKGQLAVLCASSVGDYRTGDELWCQKLDPSDYGRALNRDVIVPRPAGRFIFGRLINLDTDKLHILQLSAGSRQQVIPNPPWVGLVTKLVRAL